MDSVLNYFNGEKIQCLIGLVISIAFIITSAYFLSTQKALLNGMAYSILPLAILLSIICIGVIVRVPKDIERVTTYYKEESVKLHTEELPRMEKVMKNFSIIKKIEIGVFLVGLVLVFMFWGNGLIKGVALGLIIQGIILFLFDYVAESRGVIYINFLKS
ncbi:MAG: hypothetical protein KDD13_10880 [Mangrovimonas sp.]|nr:hypothetical protein [Mangrovimonas sp.]MCB0458048.1 hypothetical protein [Flavobacteriaceae bacterium]